MRGQGARDGQIPHVLPDIAETCNEGTLPQPDNIRDSGDTQITK